MEKSSTTKANEILAEFQRFLLEKKLAPEKNVFFYALWTSKFFNFARKKPRKNGANGKGTQT